MKQSQTEQHIYDLLEARHRLRREATLVPFRELLDRLGNPHLDLPPVIHVAGTNGKGSVLAYLDSILQTSGLRVHRYTSPHLVSICERIQLSNATIPDTDFLKTLKVVLGHADELPLTYFELITAVAFLEFKRVPADYLLLETGMGGRHDATNVIENPVATAITQIGLDHVDLLGPDLISIAREKAGIIKAGCPIVTIQQAPEILKAIKDEAELKHSPFYLLDEIENVKLGLLGAHQQQNAAIAGKIASLIGTQSEKTVLAGLRNAQWSGRMQRITIKNRQVWVDMAHNVNAAETAVQTMRELKQAPFHLIFSLRASKDIQGFVEAFRNDLLSATYIPLPTYALGHPAEAIGHLKDFPIALQDNLMNALKDIPDGPVLIAGSAILVGDILYQMDRDALPSDTIAKLAHR